MNGTCWTEPGQGATGHELMEAAIRRGRMGSRVMRAATELRHSRTNLALTGAPLTPDDLKRIEQAEVTR